MGRGRDDNQVRGGPEVKKNLVGCDPTGIQLTTYGAPVGTIADT